MSAEQGARRRYRAVAVELHARARQLHDELSELHERLLRDCVDVAYLTPLAVSDQEEVTERLSAVVEELEAAR